jgi:hypothetical protein
MNRAIYIATHPSYFKIIDPNQDKSEPIVKIKPHLKEISEETLTEETVEETLKHRDILLKQRFIKL